MAQENKSQFLLNLQSDYSAWLSQVLLSALFEDFQERKKIIFPEIIPETIDENTSIPSRVRDVQGILNEMAKNILDSESKVSREMMEVFLATFESFQSALQELQHGIIFSDFGIDELTGLPKHERMIHDLERELERRSRRGQPFCFVISQIDNKDEWNNSQNIILASNAIKKTIRSFDDAYVMDNGDFLCSLKHSDNSGGIKFVNRLNRILGDNPEVNFTMSSIVAEPLPGDDILQLIRGVKEDLRVMAADNTGVAGEYKEISQLTQYLKSLKDAGNQS